MLAHALLAIFYGIPSLVNGAAGEVQRAAATFAGYDVVVFGEGLQYDAPAFGRPAAGPLERRRTMEIIRRLRQIKPTTRVFGYVPLGETAGLTLPAVADAVQRWRDVGVHGIFFDEAGADFGVTRERQRSAFGLARQAGLQVFVNAFDPDDVFGGPAPTAMRRGDLFLIESFVVRNGVHDRNGLWRERARKAQEAARTLGIEVWTVTTSLPGVPFDARLCAEAFEESVRHGFAGFGWGEPYFGAPDSRLPRRACARNQVTVGVPVIGEEQVLGEEG